MGQANQRGTYEERKNLAIERNEKLEMSKVEMSKPLIGSGEMMMESLEVETSKVKRIKL